jgi:AhpD family alkylhydroperoxidase
VDTVDGTIPPPEETAMDAAHARSISEPPAVDGPRLAPLRWSWNPLFWIALAIYRSIGAPLPAQVIFARAPRLVVAHVLLVLTSEYALSLDRRVRSLVRVFGSRVNGCMFCDNLETRMAVASGAISREDADALGEFRTSDRFGERQRAALSYVEELNRVRQASDETFAELRRHFSEREIVELTWLNAVGN